MRASVLRDGHMVMRDDVAEPVPEPGQVVVGVKACGICGSDLHFAKHGAEMLARGEEMEGMPDFGGGPMVDLGQDVFMGHEFSAEVLEVGKDTDTFAPGTIVTSIPIVLTNDGIRPIVYSNEVLGGYSERMVLSAGMLQEVPNGLDFRHAAMTEPMAVGLHAVNRSRIKAGSGAVVLGCGPVGLAVIGALKLKGIECIVASDYSPTRRALATKMGATSVVDPAQESVFDVWGREGRGSLVVFEAIGVPGIINEALRCVPPRTRIMVVGVCMENDTWTPFYAAGKELDIGFSMAYDPMEFGSTLRSISEGELDVAPLITGEVGLDEVDGAFNSLGDPEEHCKIMVVP